MESQKAPPSGLPRVDSIKWGIECLDKATRGLAAHTINILESPDYHSGLVTLGQFLNHGLQSGETVVLITFDTPTVFLENFSAWQVRFKEAIEAEKFFILNYNPEISQEIGISHNYEALFQEIKRLCNNQWPSRIAIHQIDTLLSLNNLFLMNSCAQKLALAANKLANTPTTVLGQFVQFDDQTHQDLAIAFQKTTPGYFSLSRYGQSATDLYFSVKKLPWFDYLKKPLPVRIQDGQGIILRDEHDTFRASKTGS